MKKEKMVIRFLALLLTATGLFFFSWTDVFAEECAYIEGRAWLNSQVYSGPVTIKTPAGDIYTGLSSGYFSTFLTVSTDSSNIQVCIPDADFCISMGGSCVNNNMYFTKTPSSPTPISDGGSASGSPDGTGTSGEPRPGQDLDVFCEGDTGIETALGCIPFTVDGLVEFILKNLIGLVGSIALIMIVYGSFMVMTSSGSPEKIAQGKEIITAAISGLLFAILSIFILRLIGVTWLQLPGLN